jgi:hypothetical protein
MKIVRGNLYLVYITGTVLPSFRLASCRRTRWKTEDGFEFPGNWIGRVWELPDPKQNGYIPLKYGKDGDDYEDADTAKVVR